MTQTVRRANSGLEKGKDQPRVTATSSHSLLISRASIHPGANDDCFESDHLCYLGLTAQSTPLLAGCTTGCNTPERIPNSYDALESGGRCSIMLCRYPTLRWWLKLTYVIQLNFIQASCLRSLSLGVSRLLLISQWCIVFAPHLPVLHRLCSSSPRDASRSRHSTKANVHSV